MGPRRLSGLLRLIPAGILALAVIPSAEARPPIVNMLDLALQRFAEFQDRGERGEVAGISGAGRAPASVDGSDLQLPSISLLTGERETLECGPKPTTSGLVDDHLAPAEATYDYLRSITEDLSGSECRQVVRWELNRPGRLWADLGVVERADRIRAHAKRTFRLLQGIQKKTKNLRSSGDLRRDIYNPDYLDPVLSPELVTCLAFQETKGAADLSPHAVNYTFCLPAGRGKYASSASGLGQVTWSAMSGVSAVVVRPEEAPARLLPIKTVPRYEGRSVEELFALMNDDVPLQMEVIYRVLNYKLKFARFKDPGLGQRSPASVIEAGVASYDRDDQSDYLKNVVHACLPCLEKRRKGAALCLGPMKH